MINESASQNQIPSAYKEATDRGGTIHVPVLESPHFFLKPDQYVKGFMSVHSAASLDRNGKGEVTQGQWPGTRNESGHAQLVNLDIRAPGFIARSVARAKGIDPSYKIKVKPHF
jgi:hypothetical protein